MSINQYDFIQRQMNFLNIMSASYLAKKPFVVYRNPFQSKLTILVQQNSELHKFSGQDGFCFVDFYQQNPIVIPFDKAIIHEFEIVLKAKIHPFFNLTETQETKQRFKNLVQTALDSIQQNNYQKIVVSRPIKVNFESDIQAVSKKLVTHFPEAFTYIFYHPNIGCWIGATPEL